MLRTGQMMLAQSILMCTVGRGFRRDFGNPEVRWNRDAHLLKLFFFSSFFPLFFLVYFVLAVYFE